MPVRGEKDSGEEDRGPRGNRDSLVLTALAAAGRALEREADRWFVWIPVLFAGGIIAYFALQNEPESRVAGALVLAALGLCLALRAAPLGLAARVIVDRRMLKEGGAHALYIEGLSIRAVSVASARGHRPWVPEHVTVREAPQLTPNDAGDDACRGFNSSPED